VVLTKSVNVSVQLIERRIYLIRGHKVMIDVDLAELYEVQLSALMNRFDEIATLSQRFHVSAYED